MNQFITAGILQYVNTDALFATAESPYNILLGSMEIENWRLHQTKFFMQCTRYNAKACNVSEPICIELF